MHLGTYGTTGIYISVVMVTCQSAVMMETGVFKFQTKFFYLLILLFIEVRSFIIHFLNLIIYLSTVIYYLHNLLIDNL